MNDCPDCRADVGHPHHDACDIARCLHTGLPRFGCEGDHDCGSDAWTGEWPDVQACLEYGFVVTYPGVHGVYPDTNRLYAEAHWDPARRRWVKSDVD